MTETKRCPYCGEEIMATAKKCKHCGEWLSTDAQKQVQKKIEPEKPIAHEGESVWEKILYYLLIGAVYLWWVPIVLVIAAFTVPSEEKHLKKIEEDVIDCIQDKSNDVLDAVGLSSLSGWASLFINANVSQQAILVAFNHQNDIEVEKHWFWSNGKIYNRIYPYGKNISFGIFGFVIPYVDWDDIALLPEGDIGGNNSYDSPQDIPQEDYADEYFMEDDYVSQEPIEQGPSPSQEYIEQKEHDEEKVVTQTGTNEESVPMDKTTSSDKVFDVVEQMPSYPGGQVALAAYLSENVKYSEVAKENGVQGRVVVSFIVEKDGRITNAQIVRSVDPSLDKEAIRVVNNMPRWTPGMQAGEAVRVKYNVPVSFRIQ